MTPAEFYTHLRDMVNRIRNDRGFTGLSFFNKHQFSQLDENFKLMWEKHFKKDGEE